jgi:hypothetical protein
MIAKLFRWLKAVSRWLVCEPAPVWLAVSPVIAAGVLAVYLLPFIFGITLEDSMRYSGLLLQFGGLATIAWEISQTRASFGRPNLATSVRQWIGRFPPYNRRLVTGSGHATMGHFTVSGQGYVWSTARPDSTVERRLEVLEKNLQELNERFVRAQKELEQQIRSQAEDIKREKEARASADDEIRAKLEATQTDGLHISSMGVVWFFIGITMSTIPSELAWLFG